MEGGVGDSIYRESENYEDIKAIKLSDFLKDSELITDSTILLLRMNIGGAEYDVVEDSVENNLAGSIHGYLGMWDDVAKIDQERNKRFRKFLKQNKINPVSFSGRDLMWKLE